MKWLPAENIIFTTSLSEAEVIKRLSVLLETGKVRRTIFGPDTKKRYSGKLEGSAFSIQRIINYRNSFLPQIKGTIQNDFDGTTINLQMRLSVLVIIFLCIWCGGVMIGLLASLSRGLSTATLIPAGMLLLVYLITMAAFKIESKRSIKDLQQTWEAAIRQ